MNNMKQFYLLVLCFMTLALAFPSEAKGLRVMVFAPHPDDDLIGCGGSIAKHIANGNEVTIVYMTSGDAGSLKYTKEELAEMRELEAKKGAKVLGVTDLVFLRNPDGYLDASKENLVAVMDLIRSKKPNIVYLPHSEEGHRDHKRTNEIVSIAAGRASGPWFQESSVHEPWKVSYLLAYEVHPPLREATYCEDISNYLDLKVKALQEHKSQLEEIAYDKASESISHYRGILTAGSSSAECFHVLQADKLFFGD